MNNKFQILNLIEQILGKGSILKQNEVAFYCPFCQHHKKKLQINLLTHKYHCWVCDAKGASLRSLFGRLNASERQLRTLSTLLGTPIHKQDATDNELPILYLPKEFISLTNASNDPDYTNAISYLKGRGVGREDIIKHNIGYCTAGLYAGRIIVPSYDSTGRLNYFVGREFYDIGMKYKNPPVSKNIIGFDLHINWSEPVVLVEGVYDAIAIKRNAIPLFGKHVPQVLSQKIIESNIRLVILALDADANDATIRIAEDFIRKDILVGIVSMKDGEDPAIVGFMEMNKRMRNIEMADFGVLTKLKLKQGILWKRH